MNYLVIVSDNNGIIEKAVFSYRDEALYYLECRCKQGYFVSIKLINFKKRRKNNGSNQEVSGNNGRKNRVQNDEITGC